MSNTNQDWYDEEDFDYSSDNQTHSEDNTLQKVRRAERAKDKQLKEALAELDKLRNFQRETLVSKVLSEKGINPKVAKFIPADLEINAESINSWIEEYADIFGFTQQEERPQVAVDPENLAALRQIDAVTSGALSPDIVNNAASMINNAQTEEELLAFLYSQGAE